ncbi:PREDICTED: uncharacterized protein LOC102874695 [Elephantulus edwardii]|uniref:uncharacterized protein LOC102874695 n=1 Tax=Elephantulus edwardii TaxID=28737 RepID=UPI0003F099AA|nr:PREDICTED: uncharacterized protein LOC102874695 [Elephantulus edwardii]
MAPPPRAGAGEAEPEGVTELPARAHRDSGAVLTGDVPEKPPGVQGRRQSCWGEATTRSDLGSRPEGGGPRGPPCAAPQPAGAAPAKARTGARCQAARGRAFLRGPRGASNAARCPPDPPVSSATGAASHLPSAPRKPQEVPPGLRFGWRKLKGNRGSCHRRGPQAEMQQLQAEASGQPLGEGKLGEPGPEELWEQEMERLCASRAPVRTLPYAMVDKRLIRLLREPEGAQPSLGERWQQRRQATGRRLRETAKRLASGFGLWEGALYEIGGLFGTGVQSYFTFLRFLLLLNLLAVVLTTSFVLLPLVWLRAPDPAPALNLTLQCPGSSQPQLGLQKFHNQFWNVLTGRAFNSTYLFYGAYRAEPESSSTYSIRLAYLLSPLGLPPAHLPSGQPSHWSPRGRGHQRHLLGHQVLAGQQGGISVPAAPVSAPWGHRCGQLSGPPAVCLPGPAGELPSEHRGQPHPDLVRGAKAGQPQHVLHLAGPDSALPWQKHHQLAGRTPWGRNSTS